VYHADSTSFGGHQQAVTKGGGLNQLLDAGGGDLADRRAHIHFVDVDVKCYQQQSSVDCGFLVFFNLV
jgi:hypothetical protein